MIQKFVIKGMTCGGCKTDIEKKLNSLTGVKVIRIDLKSGAVDIETSKTILFTEINNAIGSKYSVFESNVKANSKWKSLFPLALILVYITLGALFLQKEHLSYSSFMINFMGLFFITFSFFKFLKYQTFPSSFKVYDPIAKVFPIYGWLYPFIETFLGISFLLHFQLNLMLWVTLLILSFTTFGVLTSLWRKDKIQCACLGTVFNLPMTEATLIENLIMISMCILMLINSSV